MNWSSIFAVTNVIALAGWAALLLLPRRPATYATILTVGVGLLCLAYAVIFAALFGGLADPARVAGSQAPDYADYSVAGLRALFMSDGGIVLGWTHYLAFDLFTGLWIARDADRSGVGRWAQTPILLATFLAGPIGLLIWLIVRLRRGQPAADG